MVPSIALPLASHVHSQNMLSLSTVSAAFDLNQPEPNTPSWPVVPPAVRPAVRPALGEQRPKKAEIEDKALHGIESEQQQTRQRQQQQQQLQQGKEMTAGGRLGRHHLHRHRCLETWAQHRAQHKWSKLCRMIYLRQRQRPQQISKINLLEQVVHTAGA